MSGVVNIYRNRVIPVVTSATGIGTAFSQIFVKVYEVNGAPGLLQLGLTNVVGVFSGLQINIEWSPTNGSGTYFEVVGTWSPLTAGVGLFPVSEAGYYRLNITTFTGGTAFDVLATVGLPAGSVSGGGGPSSNVTIVGSSINLPVNLNDGSGNAISSSGGSLNVNVTGGGGGGTQYANGASVVTPTGTVALGYDGSHVRALLTDTSGQAKILVENFPAFQFTNYGSPAASALDVYVVNPSSVGNVTVSGIVEVSANTTANSNGNPLYVDVTNTVPVTLTSTTITGSVAVTGTFWQATQPVSGSVSVSNFPASQAVTGTFWQTTQPVSNPVLSEMTFTNYGSPAVEALNVYVVNPSSGGGTVNQGTAAALTAPWPIYQGQTSETTAAWTSSTINNTILGPLNIAGYTTVLVSASASANVYGLTALF